MSTTVQTDTTSAIERAADAERTLVGTLLSWPGAFAENMATCSSILAPEDFTVPRARQMYEAALRLHKEGTPPDLATVRIACRELGFPESLPEDLDYTMAGTAPQTAKRQALELRRQARERQLAMLGESLLSAYKGGNSEMVLELADEISLVRAELSSEGEATDLDELIASEINWDSFWKSEDAGPEWLVEPLLPTRRHAAIYSQPGAGKSRLLLEIAAALATGRPILHSPASAPIDVVYVDMEMTKDDLMGRLSELGYTDEDDLSHLHYYQHADFGSFDTPEGGAKLEAIVRHHQAALVVIDTMASSIEGEENDADTYRDFFKCTGLRLKALGVALVRLDHSGKDKAKSQRGSSAKAADVDLVWRLEATADDSTVVLTVEKTRLDLAKRVVALKVIKEPYLTHQAEAYTYPAGVAECIADLDELGIGLHESAREATRLLKRADKGRRDVIVRAAMRARLERGGAS